MRQSSLAQALLLGALAAPAFAQTAPPPRAKGPALDLAVDAAQTAIQACLANGYKTVALVTDSEGVPVALLSADGASAIAQQYAPSKAAVTIRYKAPSGAIFARLKGEPALAAEVKADPKMPYPWPGAFPLMAGGEQIGVLAVAGAPSGDKDEACAQSAIAKIAARLK